MFAINDRMRGPWNDDDRLRSETLKIWKDSVDLFNQMEKTIQHFPENVQLNLDEGIRQSSKDYMDQIAHAAQSRSRRDYQFQLKSAMEHVHRAVAQLYIAKQCGYVNRSYFDQTFEQARELSSKLCLFGGFTYTEDDVN